MSARPIAFAGLGARLKDGRCAGAARRRATRPQRTRRSRRYCRPARPLAAARDLAPHGIAERAIHADEFARIPRGLASHSCRARTLGRLSGLSFR
jgi:hypothetical protein